MKKRYNFDLAIIFLWPIIASALTFLFNAKALGSIIFFLAIPSLYLGIRGKQYVKKVLLFTFVISIPAMVVLDYIAQINGSWIMYPISIFPFKFFGLVTFEVILWAFLTIFFILIFYEYFIDQHRIVKLWKNKMTYLFVFAILFFSVFILFFFLGASFKIPYFYFLWGIALLLIPFLLQLFKYPKTTSKFFLALVYFFYMNFIYEVTALKVGAWTFPGTNFIGWVNILGVSFPLEEVFFWMILMTLAILSFFEFFDDDEK